MDRLYAMEVFVHVAEALSFAAAARTLGVSRPSVTRAIANLEEAIGAELLVRTTRSVALSEVGKRYLEDCRRILDAVREAEAAAVGSYTKPSGQLVLTAPVMFGRLHVLPVIQMFLERYPEVSVCAMFLDRVTDLIEEGVDVGVRIGRLPDSSLAAIRVGAVTLMVCGAPAYLDAYGTPQVPADLDEHTIIASGVLGGRVWRFAEASIPIKPRFLSNSIPAALDLAARGFGLVRALSYQVAHLIEDGRLQRVLVDHEVEPLPVQLVRPGGRPPAKVRAFLDLAAEQLRKNPRIA